MKIQNKTGYEIENINLVVAQGRHNAEVLKKMGIITDDESDADRLTAELSETQKRLAVAEKALEYYQFRCDNCHHALIEHLHDGEIGFCMSSECYEERCQRFVNVAREALAEINK